MREDGIIKTCSFSKIMFVPDSCFDHCDIKFLIIDQPILVFALSHDASPFYYPLFSISVSKHKPGFRPWLYGRGQLFYDLHTHGGRQDFLPPYIYVKAVPFFVYSFALTYIIVALLTLIDSLCLTLPNYSDAIVLGRVGVQTAKK